MVGTFLIQLGRSQKSDTGPSKTAASEKGLQLAEKPGNYRSPVGSDIYLDETGSLRQHTITTTIRQAS